MLNVVFLLSFLLISLQDNRNWQMPCAIINMISTVYLHIIERYLGVGKFHKFYHAFFKCLSSFIILPTTYIQNANYIIIRTEYYVTLCFFFNQQVENTISSRSQNISNSMPLIGQMRAECNTKINTDQVHVCYHQVS